MQQRGYGYGYNPYAAPQAGVDSRDRFLARTYNHLFGAIVLFVLVELGLFMSGIAPVIARSLGGNWLLVLGGFMLVSWLATRAAHSATSKASQYLGLGAFVVAQAIIFVPLLYIANAYAPGAISSAGLVTLAGFAGLTGLVLWTRKDFSFLGALLRWIGIGALLLIGASLVFGLKLGTFFSVGMVVFAGAAILYDTSNILHRYPEDRYVGAALQLFASVALLFYYVLMLFAGRRD